MEDASPPTGLAIPGWSGFTTTASVVISCSRSLIRRLGLGERLEWLQGSTGSYAGGTCYPLTTPREILAYPGLTLMQKARLAWLTRRSRTMNVEALDTITAKDFILEHLGEEGYRAFFEPLLKSKFGERRDEVSAAWLVSRIAIRSDRGIAGERLGYIRGGFQLPDRGDGSRCRRERVFFQAPVPCPFPAAGRIRLAGEQ